MQNQHEDELRRRAYRIWEDEGRPDGRDREHWARAEEEVGRAPVGEDNLDRDPGISRSKGAAGADLKDISGENTVEGDVLSDTTPTGGIDPGQRGGANK